MIESEGFLLFTFFSSPYRVSTELVIERIEIRGNHDLRLNAIKFQGNREFCVTEDWCQSFVAKVLLQQNL